MELDYSLPSKFPRIKHLPFSPGATKDDKIMSEQDLDNLLSEEVVILEKLDGSSVYFDDKNFFARSHGSVPKHPSFNGFKEFYASLNTGKWGYFDKHGFYGEWCAAVHTIEYSLLPSYFFLFAVKYKGSSIWYEFDYVLEWGRKLGLTTPPIILREKFSNREKLQKAIEIFSKLSSVYGPEREGFVIWPTVTPVVKDGCFKNVAKWVRADFVSGEHWSKKSVKKQPCVKNKKF